MSAQSKKLVGQIHKQEEKETASWMKVIGKTEIMILWDGDAKKYMVLRPGDSIPTFLYTEAKKENRVLNEGEFFHFTKLVVDHEIECWYTCILNEAGYAKFVYDDQIQKAKRERYQAEGAQVAELKQDLNDTEIKYLRVAAEGQAVLVSNWLKGAVEGLEPHEKKLIEMVFRGWHQNLFGEEETRAVLETVGCPAPDITGMEFTRFMFGVKTLFVNTDFLGLRKKTVKTPAVINGKSETNGHTTTTNGHDQSTDEIEDTDHFAGLADVAAEEETVIGPEHAERAAGISEAFAPAVR